MNIKTPQIEELFKSLPHIDFKSAVDISHLSTMRLKSVGNYVLIKNIDELKELLPKLNEFKIPYKMIGWGANQILPEDATDRVFIKINSPNDVEKYFYPQNDSFWLPAGIGLNVLISRALKYGYVGWEVLTGIPANVGGAAFMNAGTKFGDFSQIISQIKIMDKSGNEKIISIDKASFSYRKNNFLKTGEVITEVEVFYTEKDVIEIPKKINEYLEFRRKTQPIKSNNCGCIFKNKNGKSAGQIIDQLGLKGMQIGQMRISNVHANFLENIGGATERDFWNLVEFIQDKAEKHLGSKLDLEISF